MGSRRQNLRLPAPALSSSYPLLLHKSIMFCLKLYGTCCQSNPKAVKAKKAMKNAKSWVKKGYIPVPWGPGGKSHIVQYMSLDALKRLPEAKRKRMLRLAETYAARVSE